jgi:DNA-binding response OmpR family regulator
MSRIALLEDHARLAELVRQALARASIVADVFSSMDSAWHARSKIAYEAFIVDRGLPDGDGLHFVKRLREAGCATPCLMLTARDALHDRVEGLDGGADDYLSKPFPMEELIARVRALLRRPTILQDAVYIYADLRLEADSSALRCDRQSLPLPITELQIMLCLIRKPGATVRRSALEAAAWGLSEAVTPNALDVAIHRLRRKMDDMKSRVQIVNVRGLGYALCEIAIAE